MKNFIIQPSNESINHYLEQIMAFSEESSVYNEAVELSNIVSEMNIAKENNSGLVKKVREKACTLRNLANDWKIKVSCSNLECCLKAA